MERRPGGLVDERLGAPRTITDAQVEEVLTQTLEQTPADATHWSRTSMAKRSGLSRSTVGRVWKAFSLKPHLSETFKPSKDPLFVEKVRDVVGLYLDPPERAVVVVLCVDEKSQVQARDRSQPVLPMMPGMPEKRTHDYARHGVTSLFAALDMASGQVIGALHRRHRSTEYRQFLITIDQRCPPSWTYTSSATTTPPTKPTSSRNGWPRTPLPRALHPTGSSWLNMVEHWFGELTTKLLQRGVHKSVKALEADIQNWIKLWNEDPKPYVWTKTADEILESLARYCQTNFGRRTLVGAPPAAGLVGQHA